MIYAVSKPERRAGRIEEQVCQRYRRRTRTKFGLTFSFNPHVIVTLTETAKQRAPRFVPVISLNTLRVYLMPSPALFCFNLTSRGSIRPLLVSVGFPSAVPGVHPCCTSRRCPTLDGFMGSGRCHVGSGVELDGRLLASVVADILGTPGHSE
jgi:hypothetical protein